MILLLQIDDFELKKSLVCTVQVYVFQHLLRENLSCLPLKLRIQKKKFYVIKHVERAVGLVCCKNKISQSPLPVELVKATDVSETQLDNIVMICCALVNNSPSVVPLL